MFELFFLSYKKCWKNVDFFCHFRKKSVEKLSLANSIRDVCFAFNEIKPATTITRYTVFRMRMLTAFQEKEY